MRSQAAEKGARGAPYSTQGCFELALPLATWRAVRAPIRLLLLIYLALPSIKILTPSPVLTFNPFASQS